MKGHAGEEWRKVRGEKHIQRLPASEPKLDWEYLHNPKIRKCKYIENKSYLRLQWKQTTRHILLFTEITMSSTWSKRLLKEFKMVKNEEDFVELVDHTSGDIGKWQVKVLFCVLVLPEFS